MYIYMYIYIYCILIDTTNLDNFRLMVGVDGCDEPTKTGGIQFDKLEYFVN